MRLAINNGDFPEFKKEFLGRYQARGASTDS